VRGRAFAGIKKPRFTQLPGFERVVAIRQLLFKNSFEAALSLCTGREISRLLGRTPVAAFRCIQHGAHVDGLLGSQAR